MRQGVCHVLPGVRREQFSELKPRVEVLPSVLEEHPMNVQSRMEVRRWTGEDFLAEED